MKCEGTDLAAVRSRCGPAIVARRSIHRYDQQRENEYCSYQDLKTDFHFKLMPEKSITTSSAVLDIVLSVDAEENFKKQQLNHHI